MPVPWRGSPRSSVHLSLAARAAPRPDDVHPGPLTAGPRSPASLAAGQKTEISYTSYAGSERSTGPDPCQPERPHQLASGLGRAVAASRAGARGPERMQVTGTLQAEAWQRAEFPPVEKVTGGV